MFALAKPLCRLILVPAVLLCCLGLPGIDSVSGPSAAFAGQGAKKKANRSAAKAAKKGKKKGKRKARRGKRKARNAKKAAQAALR
jgi:hypothetical protein